MRQRLENEAAFTSSRLAVMASRDGPPAAPAREAASRSTAAAPDDADAWARKPSTRSQSIEAMATACPRGPQPSSTASTNEARKSRRRSHVPWAMSSSTAASLGYRPAAQARSIGSSCAGVRVVGSISVTEGSSPGGRSVGGGDVDVVVVAIGGTGGVVDTAPGVGPPALRVVRTGPDPALPDDVVDVQAAALVRSQKARDHPRTTSARPA